MRVLILGANGLIGSYIVAKLFTEGHELIGLGRDLTAARRRMPHVHWVRADLRQMCAPADWADLISDVDAVVNCAGALQDNPRDDLAAVHVLSAQALYAECESFGGRRVVLISAAGVAPGRGTQFNDTKLSGEAALKSTDLEWIILRPGLVLAPAAYGGTALLRGLAGTPGLIVLAHAESVVQVVSVDDVAQAVARSIAPSTAPRQSLDLVSREPTQLRDVVIALRAWLGLAPAPVLVMPGWTATVAGVFADGLAWLGWRSPLRSTSVTQLAAGVTGDSTPAEQALGLKPQDLHAMLASWPSGVQERWFSRLYFLKPAILAGLVLFWIASGLIGLTTGLQAATALISDRTTPSLAQGLVVGGSILDVAVGIGLAFRASAPAALKGALATCVAYLIAGTLVKPELWADPLGPLVKILPVLLLTLAAMAMTDER